MSNGDTASKILEFLEHDDPDIPKTVTNTMLLIAVRETNLTFKYNFDSLDKKVDDVLEIARSNEKRIADVEKEQARCVAVETAKKDIEEKQEEKKRTAFEKAKDILASPPVAAGLGAGVIKLLDALFGK